MLNLPYSVKSRLSAPEKLPQRATPTAPRAKAQDLNLKAECTPAETQHTTHESEERAIKTI